MTARAPVTTCGPMQLYRDRGYFTAEIVWASRDWPTRIFRGQAVDAGEAQRIAASQARAALRELQQIVGAL